MPAKAVKLVRSEMRHFMSNKMYSSRAIKMELLLQANVPAFFNLINK